MQPGWLYHTSVLLYTAVTVAVAVCPQVNHSPVIQSSVNRWSYSSWDGPSSVNQAWPTVRSWLQSAHVSSSSGITCRTGGHGAGLCVTFHAQLLHSFPCICLQFQFRNSTEGLVQGFERCIRSNFPTCTQPGGASRFRGAGLEWQLCDTDKLKVWIMLKSDGKTEAITVFSYSYNTGHRVQRRHVKT